MRPAVRRRLNVAIFVALGVLLLVNVVYLTSLSPGSDLDIDLLDDGVVARRQQIHEQQRQQQRDSHGEPEPVVHARRALSSRNGSRCASAGAAPIASARNPNADSHAVIIVGGTMRLTVLTERTIRIEQHNGGPSGTFDDRPSFAIINRHLPPPAYDVQLTSTCELLSTTTTSHCLVLTTARLRLELAAPPDATAAQLTRDTAGGHVVDWPPPRPPTSATLRVRLILDASRGTTSEWHPGKPNPRQLPGTIRTLDKADGPSELVCDKLPAEARGGAAGDAHCAMGVISRDGWALLDDSNGGRFGGGGGGGASDGSGRHDGKAAWTWAAPLEPAKLAAERAARAADGDPRCEGWARSGECERNGAFMKANCQPACGRAKARAAAAAAEAKAGGPLRFDWYLFAAGLDYAGALRDLAALSGAQPMPPRYAFGVWSSRWCVTRRQGVGTPPPPRHTHTHKHKHMAADVYAYAMPHATPLPQVALCGLGGSAAAARF